ncbi:MAG: MBL fold metallo-hydrolase [Pseudomonadota bacterium]
MSFLACLLWAGSAWALEQADVDLRSYRWHYGTESCETDAAPPIEVLRVNPSSFILRQNKCQHFEAPFMFLLLGTERALLLDTGAIESADLFPIYATVRDLLAADHAEVNRELVVVHSHSHLDHQKGDLQFRDKASVTLVEPNSAALEEFFNFVDWPRQTVQFDLGQRLITVIPTPGHHAQAISLYDPLNQWLLTGDTLYPGSIRVKDWQAFRSSVQRLWKFSETNPVSLILGTHIEMSRTPGEMYDIGSTYQPQERALTLEVTDLKELNQQLQRTPKAKKMIFDKFHIAPLNWLERKLSDLLSPD